MVKLVVIIAALMAGGVTALSLMQRHHQAVAVESHQMIPPSPLQAHLRFKAYGVPDDIAPQPQTFARSACSNAASGSG
jgi:hypothetical protein